MSMASMKMVATLLCCVLITSGAHADEVFDHPQTASQLLSGPLAQPTAALRNAQAMRGKFIYRKYLHELPQPLISRGDFLFAKGLGIDWHTREPFDSDFVLTPNGITQSNDGKTTQRMTAAEQPAVKVVAQIFLALLSLDVTSLQNSFALFGMQGKSGNEKWQVGLKPTVAAVASVFRDAIVSGGAQVDSLVLHDANGDHTEITFVDLQYGAQLSADDRARFATP